MAGEADEPELGVAELVSRVRDELETLDAARQTANKPALFTLEQLELELQFTAVERLDGRGGIDLKVISVGGSKGVESTAVQKIRLRFALDEDARRLKVPGVRSHSSAAGTENLKDTEPIEFDDVGS